MSYQLARNIAAETSTSLAVIECCCSDEWLWSQRIDGRKTIQLPAHHQTNWEAFKSLLAQVGVFKEQVGTHMFQIPAAEFVIVSILSD
jgi:hypothetical protein